MSSNANEVRLPPLEPLELDNEKQWNAAAERVRPVVNYHCLAWWLVQRERQLLDTLRKLAEAEAENAELKHTINHLAGGGIKGYIAHTRLHKSRVESALTEPLSGPIEEGGR